MGGSLMLYAFDADDRPIPVGRVAWTSSDPVVATVDAEGRVTGLSPGVATIAAKAGSATASSRVAVERPVVAAIEIQGASAVELIVGQRLQLAAIVRDANGERLTDRELEWSSDALNVVAVDGSGFVRAVSPGSGNVTASVEGVSACVAIRVYAAPVVSVRLKAAKSSIAIGEELAIAVTVENSRGEVLDREVRWNALPEDRVSFEDGAVVRGVRAGRVEIRAEVDGISGSLALEVVGHPTSIAIDGAPRIDVDLGESRQLRAVVLDENGDPIDGKEPVWTASDYHFAIVYVQGAMEARKLGTIMVTATYGGVQARALLRVGIPRFSRITGGEGSVCGITGDGRVFCWGQPHGLQAVVVNGLYRTVYAPARVLPGFGLESLTVGTFRQTGGASSTDTHYCGILLGGDTFCSGVNYFGVVGNGTTAPASEPYVFGQAFKLVDTGLTHGCAIDQDDLAWCWGRNDFGQLGTGDEVERWVPTPVAGGLRFSSIYAARDGGATCGITTSGDAWCWGRNQSDALGNDTEQDSSVPVPVSGAIAFQSISILSGLPGAVVDGFDSSSGHACGLSRDGQGYCWGKNGWGQLGNGGIEPSSVPVEVAGGHTFRQIEISHPYRSEWDSTSCGLTTDGEVLCWGSGYNGELGRPCNSPVECEATEPRPVEGDFRFEQLAIGGGTICGLSRDGVAYCWGAIVSQATTWEPTPIFGQERWVEDP
ncbi:hypothetical protein AKJ08_0413 [Vulgatibacter incomptus]|uniref:BIG2 domain-containing protein n=1 Tax=Vulgatibacter incomptus TaxID=1391653 RepID=A0A0K1P9C7_9BACT|nr:hypothetical protein AKJ08_0413 [Vulgatibacter incomptus]